MAVKTFLDLPTELRCRVYDVLFATPPASIHASATSCTVTADGFSATLVAGDVDQPASILRTSKRICGEAVEALYSNAVLVSRVSRDKSDLRVSDVLDNLVPGYGRRYESWVAIEMGSEFCSKAAFQLECITLWLEHHLPKLEHMHFHLDGGAFGTHRMDRQILHLLPRLAGKCVLVVEYHHVPYDGGHDMRPEQLVQMLRLHIKGVRKSRDGVCVS
jgi:hypothetical protein